MVDWVVVGGDEEVVVVKKEKMVEDVGGGVGGLGDGDGRGGPRRSGRVSPERRQCQGRDGGQVDGEGEMVRVNW